MRDGASILILAFLAVAFALPYTLGDDALFPFHTASLAPWNKTAPQDLLDEPTNHNVGDKHLIIHPDVTFTKSEVNKGRMPLWNPHNFAGLPHQANPLTAATYPPNAIFALVEPFRAYGILAAFHLLLLSGFTFAFLRSLSLRPGPALLGAIGMGASGWVSVHLHHSYFLHAFTWLPLALLSVQHLLTTRPRWALMTLPLSIGMMFLAGFPQTAVLNCWVLLVWTACGLVRVARENNIKFAAKRAGLLTLFAAVGLAMAAIQLGPAVEFSQMAGHKDIAAADLHADRLRSSTLVTLAMPDFFGHPSEKNSAPNFFNLWLLADAPGNNYSERNFHPGLTILLLAVLGLFLNRSRHYWLLLLMAIGSVLIATGTPLLDIASRLPGLDFGSPMRFTQVAAFALPCLAAFGLSSLLQREPVGRFRHRFIVIGGASLLSLIAVPLLALWIAPTWSVERATDIVVEQGIDRELGVQSFLLEKKQGLLAPSVGQLRRDMSRVFVLLLLTWLIVLGYFNGRLNGVVTVLALCILTAADLGEQMFRFNQPVQSKGLYETPSESVDFLRKNLGDARFIRFGRGSEQTFFTPNAPMVYGLNDAQGFRALTPTMFLDFMRTVEPNPYDVGLLNIAEAASLNAPQLRLLRVKYAISELPIVGSPWPLVYPEHAQSAHEVGFLIYENPRYGRRAFLAHNVHVLPDDKMLEHFENLDGEPDAFSDDVWLSELPNGIRTHYPTATESAPDQIRLTRDEPGHITVQVASRNGGVLVLSEQYASGWRIDVHDDDGGRRESLQVLRANHTFIGAKIEPGETTLQFIYDPGSFLYSGVLSGAAIIFCLLIPLMGRFATPRKPSVEELLD